MSLVPAHGGETANAALDLAVSEQTLVGEARRIVVIGSVAIIAVLLLAACWGLLAPLDEGVVSPGVVQVDSKRKPVQYPVTAAISKVFVKEGQLVKAGTLLVQMDDTQIAAAHRAALDAVLALKATEARLDAERSGAAEVRFNPDAGDGALGLAHSDFALHEQRLFAARRSSQRSELAVLAASLEDNKGQERAIQSQLDGRRGQLKLLSEQVASSRSLADQGFISRNKLLDEERVLIDLSAQVDELIANVSRVRWVSAELKLKMLQKQRDVETEVGVRAVEVKRDLAAAVQRLAAAQAELARARIVSPADGSVVGLSMQSPGAVVPEGARIMDIVPLDEALVVEAMVSPDVVDRIHPGLPADVRFSGYADLPFLAIEGRVLSVSADRIDDTANRPPHYLARIELLPQELDKLRERPLRAGMAAEVFVRTGERTLFAYLMKPLSRRVAGAMTER